MRSVSVVAVSSTDKPATGAIEVLSYLVSLRLCDPFISVNLGQVESRDMAEVPARQITVHGQEEVGLNMALATLGTMSRVRLVSATTLAERTNELDRLSTEANALGAWLRKRVKHPIRVTEARLSIPLDVDVPDIEPFFGPRGTANLIALGEDEVAVGAVALKSDAFTPQQRSAHAAFEIATTAGLWTAMDSAPIDDWDFDAGAGDPATHVAFISSAARVVIDSSPDARDALSIRGELPVPNGFTFVPPFAEIEDDIVDAVYPPGLSYRPSERMNDRGEAPPVTFGAVLRELGRLPVYALSSVTRDLSTSGRESMREILIENGFEDVMLSQNDDDDGLLTEDDIDAIVASAEREALRPRPDPIPGEYWEAMISGIFGMIDGSAGAADIRENVSDERQVLTDQSRIVVPGTNLTATARALTGTPGTESAPEEEPANNDDASTKEEPSSEGSPGMSSSARVSITNRATVLTKIGTRIRTTIDDADDDFERTEQGLRATAEGLARWQQLEVITIVPWILALGLFLLAFAIGALTPLREYVQLDFYDGSLRSTLFIGASALLVLLSGLAIIGRSGRRWQGYAAFGAVLLGIGVGVLFGYADQIFASTTDGAGIIIGLLVVIMTIVGIVRAKDAGDDATARVLRNVGLVYLASIAIVAGARTDLGFQESFGESQTRLAVALVIGAVVTAIAVSVIVAIARVRQQSAIDAAARAFEYYRHNLARAADASRRLQNALGQWAYTGSSMNYLVQFPFGQADQHTRSLDDLYGVGLLRFQLLALEMSQDGKQALPASLLVASTTPGWLGRQYETVVSAFTEREARINGLSPEQANSFRPDESEIPLGLDSTESVKARSSRVRFAQWLNSGDADSWLTNPIDSEDLVDSYRMVLDHAPSYRLRPLGEEPIDEGLTISELFSSIVPDVARHVPQHVVPGNLFGANDPEQKMTSTVWWPRAFATQPTGTSDHLEWNQSVASTAAEGTNQVVLQTIRFDRSLSFPLHELVGSPIPRPISPSVPDDEM